MENSAPVRTYPSSNTKRNRHQTKRYKPVTQNVIKQQILWSNEEHTEFVRLIRLHGRDPHKISEIMPQRGFNGIKAKLRQFL